MSKPEILEALDVAMSALDEKIDRLDQAQEKVEARRLVAGGEITEGAELRAERREQKILELEKHWQTLNQFFNDYDKGSIGEIKKEPVERKPRNRKKKVNA